MPPTPAQLGAAIRRLRTERELTIEALASTAGIHWTYLTGIETGKRNPTWKIVGAIAGALEVTIAELAQRAETPVDRD